MFNGKASLSIVHTESSRGWGGQERRILREMELMQSLGHRVMLVAPERSEIFRQAAARRIPAVAASFVRSRFPAEILRLKSIFQKLKPDVVSTHSSRDGWVASIAAKLAGVPLVLKYRHVSVPVRPGLLNYWHY